MYVTQNVAPTTVMVIQPGWFMGILVVSSSLTKQKTRWVTVSKPEDFSHEDNLCAQVKRNINDLHNAM